MGFRVYEKNYLDKKLIEMVKNKRAFRTKVKI